jgi:hypothetical protein
MRATVTVLDRRLASSRGVREVADHGRQTDSATQGSSHASLGEFSAEEGGG